MPKFCAHLGYQFTEVHLADRFGAAADAGFTAIEHPAPYSVPAIELARHLKARGLAWIQFALPMGNSAAGEKGIVCHPGRESEIEQGLERAIDYAESLSCPRIHAMSGIVPKAVSREAAIATYTNNLRFIADRAAQRGLEVLVESINSIDVPGYLVDRPSLALKIIENCARPNVRLLLDTYHATTMDEDPVGIIRSNSAAIGHVQVADHPGRHEPGTGCVPFAEVFASLDGEGYAGWVGCEYIPAGRTEDGLGWLTPYWSSQQQ